MDYLTTHTSLSPMAWVCAWLCKLQKRCNRLAAASDKVYQMLAHGRWFFPCTPASSTTKTGRHDITEILLKVALNTINQIKSNRIKSFRTLFKVRFTQDSSLFSVRLRQASLYL